MSQRNQQLAVKEQASKQQEQDIKQQGIQQQRINTANNQSNTIQQSLNQGMLNAQIPSLQSSTVLPNDVQETKELAVSSKTNQTNVTNPDIKIHGMPNEFTMADDTSNFTKMQMDYDKTLNNFSSLSVKSPSLNLNLSRTNANDTTRPGIFTNLRSAVKTIGDNTRFGLFVNNNLKKSLFNTKTDQSNRNWQAYGQRPNWHDHYDKLAEVNPEEMDPVQLAKYTMIVLKVLGQVDLLMEDNKVPNEFREQYGKFLYDFNLSDTSVDPVLEEVHNSTSRDKVTDLQKELEEQRTDNNNMVIRIKDIDQVQLRLQQKEASLDLLINQLSERNFELDNKQKSLIGFQEDVRKSQQRLENEKIEFGLEQNKYQMRETPQKPDDWSKGTIVKDVNDINPYNLSPNITGRQYLSQPVTNVNQTPVPTQQTQQPQLQVQHRSLKIDPNTPVYGRSNITIDKWIFQFENTCVTNGVPENMYVRIAINYTANLAKEITERNIKEHQTWETYKKEMVDTFTDVNHRHKLKVRLLALKQTGSYAKFAEEFQYLSSLLNTSDEDKVVLFLEGLNAETRRLLAIVNPKTFVEAHTWASQLSISEPIRHVNLAHSQKSSIICHYCKKRGHVERECNQKQKNLQVSKNSYKPSNSYNPPVTTNLKPFKKPLPVKNFTNKQFSKDRNYGDKSKSSKDATCYRCNRKGHKADKCFVRLGNLAEVVDESKSEETTQQNLNRIYSENISDIVKPEIFNAYQKGKLEESYMVHHRVSNKPDYELIKVRGTVEGSQVIYALDSGATCSIVNLSLVERYQWPLKESDVEIKTADGSIKKVYGTVGPLEVEIGGLPLLLELMVLPQECEWDILLGLDYLKPSDSAIFFNTEKFVLGNGNIVYSINKSKEKLNEVNTVSVTVEEEELFPSHDWRDEFSNLTSTVEFEEFFFKHGKFMPKRNYSEEEKEFMDKYVNLNKLIQIVKNKKEVGKARIWQKPIGVPEVELN